MNRLLTSTIGCAACLTMASVADAQYVRVGPFGGVSVRAPFVSVDTLPYGGGARVRAPFVSVDTRAYSYGYGYPPYGYRYHRPYGQVFYEPVLPGYRTPVYMPPLYPQVVYPQTGDTRVAKPAINDTAVPGRLRGSALQLKRSLSLRRDDSDVWLQYLAPDRIVQAIDSSAEPSSLSDLLLNYEGVLGNASLRSISNSSGFGETLHLLRAFVKMPADSNAAETATTNDEAAGEPTPASEPKSETTAPTPAAPVTPAGEEEVKQGKEELPLPPPAPTPL